MDATLLAHQRRVAPRQFERPSAAEGQRDYLRQAHAAALTLSQRLLPERAESRPERTWWAFWRRAETSV